MRHPVRIGPETRIWRLPGAGALGDWLDSQPWENARAPLVARIPRDGAELFHDWLLGELRRADTHEESVGMLSIRPPFPPGDCRAALRGWLDITDSSILGLAEAMNKMARSQPRIFVAWPDNRHASVDWAALLTDLQDIDSKLDVPGPLAFVLAVPSATSVVATTCRLDVGWPAPQVEEGPSPVRWGAYLHERVAWHCAGRLELVGEVDQLPDRVRRGDDLALESALDLHAAACVAAIDSSLLEQLQLAVSAARHHPELMIPQGLVGLESRGERAAPWLARGLLGRFPDHPNRRYLEALVVCRPLASRVLGRCTELEARLRDLLVPNAAHDLEDPGAVRTVRRLCADASCVEHVLEPSGRVRSLDPKEMASLFVLLQAAGIPQSLRNGLHRLRYVRNALAHGSGIGWKGVHLLAEFEELVAKAR